MIYPIADWAFSKHEDIDFGTFVHFNIWTRTPFWTATLFKILKLIISIIKFSPRKGNIQYNLKKYRYTWFHNQEHHYNKRYIFPILNPFPLYSVLCWMHFLVLADPKEKKCFIIRHEKFQYSLSNNMQHYHSHHNHLDIHRSKDILKNKIIFYWWLLPHHKDTYFYHQHILYSIHLSHNEKYK